MATSPPATASSSLPITLRTPSSTGPSSIPIPTAAHLAGTWHVTHSTLPMWRSARNVRITYTPLPPASPSDTSPPKLDDLVEYQSLPGTFSLFSSSDAVKTVRGVDTPVPGQPAAYSWRGKGWLMIASSAWEVLGWGKVPLGDGEERGEEEWAVTYFQKTMFTPAGLDVYSRGKEGLTERTLEGVKRAMEGCEDEVVRRLAKELFVVRSD